MIWWIRRHPSSRLVWLESRLWRHVESALKGLPEGEMHFVATWRYQRQDNRAAISSAITGVLKPYSWARPMEDCYVINVPVIDQYNTIVTALTDIAKRYPENIWLLITPAITGGTYYGWLQQTMWTEINNRSK